ncbi:MAG: hypothetical protein Q9202_005101 [Teloschistes flavicans]
MSLGFSVADFITLPQLAYKVYTALKDAPGNHKALSDEVLSLHEALIRLADNSPNPRKHLRSRDREEFTQVVTCCNNALSDVEAILERYPFRKGKARVWARARFAAVHLTPLRLRIAAQVDRLHTYNDMVLSRCQARTERKIGRIIEALRSQDSVILTDSESICSSIEESWSEFGRALEEEGITLPMAIESRHLLKQCFMSGSIPAEANQLEGPNCQSLKQIGSPVTQPSTYCQSHHLEGALFDAGKGLEPQIKEESWHLVQSENDLPCSEPSDKDEQQSGTPPDGDSELNSISSPPIKSGHPSHDQIASSQAAVGFLNMKSLGDEETQGFWVLQQ